LKRNAFTLVEIAMTVFLVGVLGTISYYYLNLSKITQIQYKSTVQSHINLIESTVFQCKSLSEQFPKELDGSTNASNTLLSELECNTSTPYDLDGGRNGFVPLPPGALTPYRATESGSVFFISTSAENNSTEHEALRKLILGYTDTQAVLESNATDTTLKFYLSR
jgi:hypothetical protein